MEKLRAVTFYKDYFDKFFSKQSTKVKEKIIWTIELIETQRKIPEVYFKHIENTKGIYEIRVQQGSNIYRIFCFYIPFGFYTRNARIIFAFLKYLNNRNIILCCL